MASGLSMGAQEAAADVKAEMMAEWLTGEVGGLEVCLRSILRFISGCSRSDISRTNYKADV
jgi:hypothetical protein